MQAESFPLKGIAQSLPIYRKLTTSGMSELLNTEKCYTIQVIRACSSVDRASDSGSEGRGFESLHAR